MGQTWTSDPASLPETKLGEDLAYAMANRIDGSCVLLLSLPNYHHRGRLYLSSGLKAGLRSDPQAPVDEIAPCFLLAHGNDPIKLLASSIQAVREALGTFRLRVEKQEPEFIDHLGWCTWDAFYHEVCEEVVQQGVDHMQKGGHRPGFVIIDGGWQDLNQDTLKLRSIKPDAESFPSGLKALCHDLRKKHGVRWIGV